MRELRQNKKGEGEARGGMRTGGEDEENRGAGEDRGN